jgi:hypothetical protein
MHAILIAGAALVGLPVLLHLIMKQEPKRLSFPAFRFLTQKLKTNQRKLRLRHFVLLALRMLLIALFCLALYQPTLKSDRLNIRGEQPIATVIVIDTSPSMAYTQNEKTRLQDAVRRARELLDELPEKSPVAVLTTDDPTERWRDVPEARKLLEKLDQPRGGVQPLTAALAQAYQLLGHIDAPDLEEAGQLPKLVAVFTDRAAASWEGGQAETLKKLRETIPDPKPAHAVVDVGADQPVNVGILAAEMKPQVIPANQAAVVSVTVAAAGPPELKEVEAVVLGVIDGTPTPERRLARVPYGQSREVTFEFKNLKPGLHQVEFKLETPDKLTSDNSRFLTFKVGEARRVLVVSDEPRAAAFWQLAVNSKDEFVCVAARPEDVSVKEGRVVARYTAEPANPNPVWREDPLRVFDVVCFLGVENPGRKTETGTLWEKVRPYVEGGGKLVLIPGAQLSREGYAAGGNLMPGTIGELIDTRELKPPPPTQTAPGWPGGHEGANGVRWVLDEKAVQHPMLRPFQDWQSLERRDVLHDPRVAWKYWHATKDRAPEAAVVVYYNDAEKPDARRPAVLERGIPDPGQPTRIKGRVVLLTTRMDLKAEEWNDYWDFSNSWVVVFPTLVVRYLAGDTADANYNHQTGRTATVPLPRGGLPPPKDGQAMPKVVLDGPGIDSDLALIDVTTRQADVPIDPRRTGQPGNFRVSVESANWSDGFSLNAPAEESTLDKVPADAVEEVTGKGTVFPLDREMKLRDVIPFISDQPIDLFPWLLIAVLLLLATEGLVANRFYRKVR